MMQPVPSLDVPTPIAHTALIVAAKRAIEQQRADRLFDDPFAEKLAASEIPVLLERWQAKGDLEGLKRIRTRYVAIRTRVFDDFILACHESATQIVILGAGLDARAFRLPFIANTRLYEIDCAAVLNYKAMVLASDVPRCQRIAIASDLSQDWKTALLQQGFLPSQPTTWLLEGVLMYLTDDLAHQVVHTLSELSAPQSYLAADLVSVRSLQTGTETTGRVRRHWQFGTDDPAAFFTAYGWNPTIQQPGDAGLDFGRYRQPPPPLEVPGLRRVFLVTAQYNP
ncbi:MAG TPA: SAM-dependent methyltransferase [Allocoleopsis sp.]